MCNPYNKPLCTPINLQISQIRNLSFPSQIIFPNNLDIILINPIHLIAGCKQPDSRVKNTFKYARRIVALGFCFGACFEDFGLCIVEVFVHS